MKTNFLKTLFIISVFVFAVCSLDTKAYALDNKEYVITFRPGNVGHFNESINEYLKEYEDYGYKTELTKHGAIKITVLQGKTYPSAPSAQYIDIDGDYFVLPAEKWGPTEQYVFDNAEYVVDYGRLTSGVEYTVRYIDKTTKENVNLVSVIKGNVGEKVLVEAPASITISESTHYYLNGDKKCEIVLDEDASKNEIVFEYSREATRTDVETVINVIPGETITNIEYTETTTTAPAANPGQGGARQGTGTQVTEIPEEEPPLEEEVAEPEAEEAEESAAVPSEEETEVEILEEDTPTTDTVEEVGEQSSEEDIVYIEEPMVPASDFRGMPPAYIAALGACGTGLIISILIWAKKRKNLAER